MTTTPQPAQRVLVVDDDVDTLVLFGKALGSAGVDAVPAPTCAAAREAVARLGGVHAVVADLTLSDGDGLELAREIRRAFGSRVAIVSGHPEPAEGLPAGVDVWLHKPVSLVELREAVRRLLAR